MVPKLLQKSVRTKKQLGDVVDFIDGDRGKNYPSQGEFSSDGYCLFLSTKNVPDSSFSFSEKMFVTEEKDSQLRKGKLQRGDYVLTTRGTVGNFAYYNQKIPFENVRINSGMVILRVKSDDLNRDYLKFYLESGSFKEQVNGRVSGSAQPQLPIRDMLTISIDLPDIQTQSQVASLLSAYDDLIENNEKRIRALEEMAQLLYTEWFVKFKFPGHEKAKMVDSGTEYGTIPDGWEVKKICDLYITSSGGTPSRKNEIEFYQNGSIHWVKTKELNDNYILDTEEKITELAVKKSSAKMFPKNTVLIAMYGATIGKLGILSQAATTNQACCGFLLKDKAYSSFYIFQFLINNVEKITGLAFGAAQPNISQNTVRNLEILSPVASILEEYNKRVEPMFNKILVFQKQIKNLTQMRDLLIPQLVTGKRILK